MVSEQMRSKAPNVVQWLETELQAWQLYQRYQMKNEDYGSVGHFLLKYGSAMGPRIDLPDDVTYGKAKECFSNAFSYAVPYLRDQGYTYCEGYAYTPGLIACHHAWLINGKGEVIDPTWRDGGDVCAFCMGEKTVAFLRCDDHDIDTDVCGCDPFDVGYYEEEEDCRFCNGSGKSDHPHPSREGAEYLGVAVPQETLVKTVLAKGTHGVLDSQEFLDYFVSLKK